MFRTMYLRRINVFVKNSSIQHALYSKLWAHSMINVYPKKKKRYKNMRNKRTLFFPFFANISTLWMLLLCSTLNVKRKHYKFIELSTEKTKNVRKTRFRNYQIKRIPRTPTFIERSVLV